MSRKHLLCWAPMFILILVSGCSRIDKDVMTRAEAIPEKIKQTEESVSKYAQGLEKLKQSKEYKEFLGIYAKREKWEVSISDAKQKVENAKGLHKELQELIERNKKEENQKARVLLDRISLALKEAKENSNKPSQRAEFLTKVKKEAPKLIKTAKKEVQQIDSLLKKLEPVIQAKKNKYPGKSQDLDKRFAPFKKLSSESSQALQIAETELKSEIPDYAKLGDSCKLITKNLVDFTKQDKGLRSKIAELDRSYSKRLVDMKSDFYVKVGRCSWDEYSDWPTEHNHLYSPRPVDEETFEYFDEWPDRDLATYSKGWGGKQRVACDKAKWAKLNINAAESWPRGDDASCFWVENAFAKYYHKYIVTENGKQKETDWEQVSEDVFEEYWDDLGMDIMVKSYGSYEEEVLRTSSPPGMAYVGNPKYGKWEKDPETGKERWSWLETYAMYHLLFGGTSRHYYYHDNWNHWRSNYRGKEPYYGRDAKSPTYGTYSKRTQSKYTGSSFARKGGFKGATPSVRTAGPSGRGGGPGKSGK